MGSNRIEGGVIVFEFRGGPRDGDCVRSDVETPSDCTNEATTLWAMSGGGKPRKIVRVTAGGTLGNLIGSGLGVSDGKGASERHTYRVDERIERPDEMKIVLEHVS